MAADPLLENDGHGGTMYPDPPSRLGAYRLTAGSPMIDAGLDLRETFGLDVGTSDFFGDLIPEGRFDIGAHEYGPPGKR